MEHKFERLQSPTKILNRRIKAIPKLHQRKTSFSIGSASESEDDTRKSYSRIRNDSVCSVASVVNEARPTNETPSPKKEYTVVQRKCRRTDQTRKIAEARREFNMKFNNGKPDKQKLTMIDLIFYNPATSPMSYNKRKRKSTTSSEISDTKSIREDEEKLDDPQNLSESDNEVPAPQIKIGPNGEIVVDEKSLVIENTETKKSREALQMSEVVNGDEDTSYGVYKRIKRSKDWSKYETLRFYKALNTIGTDFTMMCELFPNRTRRELKMKFKKEEKLNKSLVDRAVMQPIEFDMTELRRDLELEERRVAESKKRAQEMKAIKATMIEQRKNMKKGEKIKGIDKNPEHFASAVAVEKEELVKKKKKTAYEAIKRGINGILSDSDNDDMPGTASPTDNQDQDSDVSENEDKAENVSNILKPTRYGRIPKARSQSTNDLCDKNIEKKRKINSDLSDEDKQQENLEPGSIMIVKSKTPTDQIVYKVYIVTDNQTKQQINLEPNVLQNLTEMGIGKMGEKNKICDIQAHNILTISAQEYSNDIEQIAANTKQMEIDRVQGNNKICDTQIHNILAITSQDSPNNIEQNNRSMSEKNLNKEQFNNESTNLISQQLPENIPKILNCANKVEISGDSIIFPFDECLTPATSNQNITVSHDDNKMIVVTENNKQCVLTT